MLKRNLSGSKKGSMGIGGVLDRPPSKKLVPTGGGIVLGRYTLASSGYISSAVYFNDENNLPVKVRNLEDKVYKSDGFNHCYWNFKSDFDDDLSDLEVFNIYFGLDYTVLPTFYCKVAVIGTIINEFHRGVGNSSTEDEGEGKLINNKTFTGMFTFTRALDGLEWQCCFSGYSEARQVTRVSLVGDWQSGFVINKSNHTPMTTDFGCASRDGQYLYFAGVDPYGTGGAAKSFVWRVNTDDWSYEPFSSGTDEDTVQGPTYLGAIDVATGDVNNKITGLCCSATKLYVARGTQNYIKEYDYVTGALTRTTNTGDVGNGLVGIKKIIYSPYTNFSVGGEIWAIRTAFGGSNIVRLGIAGDGTLSQTFLSLAFDTGSNVKDSLAISSDGHYLYVGLAGHRQQYAKFNVVGVGGGYLLKYGQEGGYRNNAICATDKFLMSYSNATGTDVAFGINESFIWVDSSNKVYLSDLGNERIGRYQATIVSGVHGLTFEEYKQTQPLTYSVSVNKIFTDEVLIEARQFDLPTRAQTYNWTYELANIYFATGQVFLHENNQFALFECITDIAGNTPFLIDYFAGATDWNTGSFIPSPVIGLMNKVTGKLTLDPTINIFSQFAQIEANKNFDLFQLEGNNAVGSTATKVTMIPRVGFSSGNPTYGTKVDYVNFTKPIVANDAYREYKGKVSIQDNGNVSYFQPQLAGDSLVHMDGWHQVSARQGDTYPCYQSLKGTRSVYRGEYEKNRLDTGNGTNYPGGIGSAAGNFFISTAHCEFRKQAQTNIFVVTDQYGLFITQFGFAFEDVLALYGRAPHLGYAGNTFSGRVALLSGGVIQGVFNDESVHSEAQYWTSSGYDAITYINVSMTQAPTYATPWGTELFTGLPKNATSFTLAGITKNANFSVGDEKLLVTTNEVKVDDYKYFNAVFSGTGADQAIDIAISKIGITNRLQIRAFIDFNSNRGYDLVNVNEGGVLVQLLDESNKKIGEFYNELRINFTTNPTGFVAGGLDMFFANDSANGDDTVPDGAATNVLGKPQELRIDVQDDGIVYDYIVFNRNLETTTTYNSTTLNGGSKLAVSEVGANYKNVAKLRILFKRSQVAQIYGRGFGIGEMQIVKT